VHSPNIERIEVAARGEVRRAKLYYLRGRIGRRARVRESRDFRPEDVGMTTVPTAAEAAVDENGAAADGAESQAVEAVETAEAAEAATTTEAEPAVEGEPEAAAEPQEAVEAEGSRGSRAGSA